MPEERALVTTAERERAFLVGMELKDSRDRWTIQDSIEELASLANTADVEVVGRMIQRLERPQRTYVGTGKVKELISLKERTGYDVVIFDDELSPRQQKSLEDALQMKVIDRTALILDIFARRAQTHEGKLQVELAQHQYLLPRLAGQWSHLERLGAGIGTRGPGEKQIETDRRLIERRIQKLKKELEDVRKHRALYRRNRKRSGIPVVALVGYTNAGKSTLLNTLSGAEVFVEDKLFATLDPTTRRLRLPDGQTILITDTVGFIHKLPPAVVAAFRATLEELDEADVLLHIVDITHSNALEQARTVEDILKDLELGDKREITVLNKIDLLRHRPTPEEVEQLGGKSDGTVMISARKGTGVEDLLGEISRVLIMSKA